MFRAFFRRKHNASAACEAATLCPARRARHVDRGNRRARSLTC